MELRYIIGRLKKLNILHRIFVHTASSNNGLHYGQLPILEYVQKHERCSQRELADIMHVSPPSIATSIKRMQKAGLLEKKVSEDDLRFTHITITPKGQELANRCRMEFDKIDEQMFKGFSEEEKEQFCNYLDRLIENLSTDEMKDKSMFALCKKEKQLYKKIHK
jgi:DNA-binding MarR family transcriptional regulator